MRASWSLYDDAATPTVDELDLACKGVWERTEGDGADSLAVMLADAAEDADMGRLVEGDMAGLD